MTGIISGPHKSLGSTGSHQPDEILVHPLRQLDGGPTRSQVQPGANLTPMAHSSAPTRWHAPPTRAISFALQAPKRGTHA